MEGFARYAVYWAPEAGSALWRFGSSWLGWDAEAGAPAAPPALTEAEAAALPAPLAEITRTPRRYGFHATLKPPFALAEGRGAAELEAAAEALAAAIQPFEAAPLFLHARGRFASLRLAAASAELSALAAATVRELDAFRAPPAEEELARRRAAGLTPAQEDNLRRWGYPYVMESFDFHLTLSGPRDPEGLEAIAKVLGPRIAPFAAAPLVVREIALFGDPGGGAPFRLLRRLPLGR